jgi:HTH-type transcriptional regulator/antitoxin HigA
VRPRLIKTEQDYQRTLKRIEKIFYAEPGTSLGDELELLATLVELYESQRFWLDMPQPVEALRAKDLIPFIGSASKVSEVLAGRRSLSKNMIRNLSAGLGIPAHVLLQEP